MALLIISNRQVCWMMQTKEGNKKKTHENYYVIIIIVTYSMRNVQCAQVFYPKINKNGRVLLHILWLLCIFMHLSSEENGDYDFKSQ